MTADEPVGEVSIRSASPNDIAAIVRIEKTSFSDPWSGNSFQTLIGRDEVLFDVASVAENGTGERVVGFSVAYVAADQAELANVAVDADLRRAGIGGRLLEHVMRTTASRGAREIFLEVRISNAAARAMYAARGFAEVGRRVKYYVKPVEDALVLRRTLP